MTVLTRPVAALVRSDGPAACGGCDRPFVWLTGLDGALCARCAEPGLALPASACRGPVELRAAETFAVVITRCIDALAQIGPDPVPRLLIGDQSIIHGSTTAWGDGDIADADAGHAAWAEAVLKRVNGLQASYRGKWRFGFEGPCLFAYRTA